MPYSPRRLRHALQPAQFLAGLLLDFLRHFRVGDGLIELGHFGGLALLAFTELTLDRRHLLAQQRLALTFVERGLGLPSDFLRQAQDLDAMRQQPQHLVHARRDIDRLEDFLLLFRLHVHVSDGEISERRWSFDRLHGREQFGRCLRQQLDRFQRLRLQIDETRLDFRCARVRFGDLRHARDKERPAAEILNNLKSLFTLANQVVRTVRRGDVAHDIGDRAHAVHVDGCRIGHLGVTLQENADLALIADRLLRRGNRLRAADRDRQHQAGEQHGIAHRHDDECVGRQWRHSAGAFG